MFVLVTISDLIHIDPWHFHKPSREALEDNINKKYANKVIQHIGLCICLWDLLKASEGLISQAGAKGVNVNVEFRMVVFRPFRGEIVQGVLLEGNPEGIRVGLDFFSDIWIPAANLQGGSRFSHEEKAWIWNPEEGSPGYYYDPNEPVRFRVEAEVWHDHTPQKPNVESEDVSVSNGTDESGNNISSREVPYTIIGSMQQNGLGPLIWWDTEGAAEEDRD